jgi:hypothetical protein
MFYAVDNFNFLKPFIENIDLIGDEFNSAKKEIPDLQAFLNAEKHFSLSHVYYWAIETMGKDDYYAEDDHRDEGVWAGFPLFKENFPIKSYDVKKHFPFTLSLIQNIPEVFFATYMRLSPQGLISTHQHKLPNLIFHLSLVDNPGGSIMLCGNQQLNLTKKGDYALFDYRIPHSTKNNGLIDRINLVIDFRTEINREKLSIDPKSKIIKE